MGIETSTPDENDFLRKWRSVSASINYKHSLRHESAVKGF
jgi:hypothetical protein